MPLWKHWKSNGTSPRKKAPASVALHKPAWNLQPATMKIGLSSITFFHFFRSRLKVAAAMSGMPPCDWLQGGAVLTPPVSANSSEFRLIFKNTYINLNLAYGRIVETVGFYHFSWRGDERPDCASHSRTTVVQQNEINSHENACKTAQTSTLSKSENNLGFQHPRPSRVDSTAIKEDSKEPGADNSLSGKDSKSPNCDKRGNEGVWSNSPHGVH